MAVTIITVAIVIILSAIGIKRMAGAAKGNGCCSSGGGELKPGKKKLEGEVIARKEMDIEGMSCINCQYKVERRINDIPGVRSRADHKKNKAYIEMDREVSDETIIKAVESIGYKVADIKSR